MGGSVCMCACLRWGPVIKAERIKEVMRKRERTIEWGRHENRKRGKGGERKYRSNKMAQNKGKWSILIGYLLRYDNEPSNYCCSLEG